MTRYHVLPDGRMGICKARTGSCPYGSKPGAKHFTNKAKAEAYSEKMIAQSVKSNQELKEHNQALNKKTLENAAPTGKTALVVDASQVGKGLTALYDPNRYSKEEAQARYHENSRIMSETIASPARVLRAQSTDGDGNVYVVSPDAGLGTMMLSLSTGMNTDNRYRSKKIKDSSVKKDKDDLADKEPMFSKDFAKPSSYVKINDDDSVDLSTVMTSTPKSKTKVSRTLDLNKALKEYEEHNLVAEDRKKALHEPFSVDHMNQAQVNAILWSLDHHPHKTGAFIINGKAYKRSYD